MNATRGKGCDVCGLRGWILKPGAEWPEPCARCGGRGRIRTMQLARLLGVHRRDVYRVERLAAGSKVGARVLNAITRAFPELFAA